MSKTISLVSVALQPSQPLDLRDAKGTVVTARAGTIWITQPDDRRDIVLRPGQSFTVDRDGLTLVSAVGKPGSVALLPTQQHAFDVVTPAKADLDMKIEPVRRSAVPYY